MEEVCDFIAKNWNVSFDVEYIDQSIEDDLKTLNSNESAIEYIITQLNIYFGEEVYEIVSDEFDSMVSFKYKDVEFSIYDKKTSRGYYYWVVEML